MPRPMPLAEPVTIAVSLDVIGPPCSAAGSSSAAGRQVDSRVTRDASRRPPRPSEYFSRHEGIMEFLKTSCTSPAPSAASLPHHGRHLSFARSSNVAR